MVDQWTGFIVAMCWKNLHHSIVVTFKSAVSYIWMCTSGLAYSMQSCLSFETQFISNGFYPRKDNFNTIVVSFSKQTKKTD